MDMTNLKYVYILFLFIIDLVFMLQLSNCRIHKAHFLFLVALITHQHLQAKRNWN